MSIEALMTQPVTILRGVEVTDRYGSKTFDWTAATSAQTTAWIARRDGSEVLDHRNAEISQWIGMFPKDVDLRAGDRVVRWGVTFEVDEPPNPAHRPQSGLHHVEAMLKVVEG